MTAERRRLDDHEARRADWKHWGPYLSDRAWGTVREDYSDDGNAWEYFPHDHARSRAYRWNEDGLAGISDRNQFLCLAVALWNGEDPILKERLFGLTGPQGNHGEDVKEYYFPLDATPTHSYLKYLYKYPQRAFPYRELIDENGKRTRAEDEYELLDTGVFDDDRYFDVLVEYAKAAENDILMRITVTNRGPAAAGCDVLPTLWFRNTWSWGYEAGPMGDVPERPRMSAIERGTAIRAEHPTLGTYQLFAERADDLLFTENETNHELLFSAPNDSAFTKDAFHRAIVDSDAGAVNPQRHGTKSAAHYRLNLGPGESHQLRLRLTYRPDETPFADFTRIMADRMAEADEFHNEMSLATGEKANVTRQALAGMIWTKQLYYFDVEQWLSGDPAGPVPPTHRANGRNADWTHVNNFDVLSMPDGWEYPWYAVWDTAFHCVPLAMVDAAFAKRQLTLMTREWYMHPNGALPAYEWGFGNANPPVHAWAAFKVYRMDASDTGTPDRAFLEGIFHKLLLNFTWWVNRKDLDGNNVFQGGFLGLDNISVFDRSAGLPHGGHIDQSDGTAWMAFYTLEMLRIALELATEDPVYQDIATKFYEHFLGIARALVTPGHCLWDQQDGFFYDVLRLPDGNVIPLEVRSMVGLMPLIGVQVIEDPALTDLPDFTRRMHWFTDNRPHLAGSMASVFAEGVGHRHLLSVLTADRLRAVLRYMLDEQEFLSPHGIRSLSKVHGDHPFTVTFGGESFTVGYEPAESQTDLFGGNSNWRGPVWFPINYLLIEALREYHSYYGDEFRVECPTGSGTMMTLTEVADEIARRLVSLFLPDHDGRRPLAGSEDRWHRDPHWEGLLQFPEYFHGDTGAGLGATHQTGWTGLIADLIRQLQGD